MVGKRRYLVYIGLFFMMFINYVDRMNLSVAAKHIADHFGLSPVQMGYIFSAYLWTYILLLIPTGLAADRFGGRAIMAGSLTIWSLAGAWTGLANSYISLFASRLVLGVGEAAAYPAGGKAIREWAPPGERARNRVPEFRRSRRPLFRGNPGRLVDHRVRLARILHNDRGLRPCSGCRLVFVLSSARRSFVAQYRRTAIHCIRNCGDEHCATCYQSTISLESSFA
jgi:hypothetical protein